MSGSHETKGLGGRNGHQHPSTNGVHDASTTASFSTDLLIVGTGPAGASLACFLASHGWYSCARRWTKNSHTFRTDWSHCEPGSGQRGHPKGSYHEYGSVRYVSYHFLARQSEAKTMLIH